MGFNLEGLIKLRLNTQKINKPKELDIEPNPCWEGYEPIGLKDDGSPNCVPIKASIVKDGFPIPSPSGDEDESTFIARCNKEMYDEFPDDAQRNAVCYQKWNEK